MEAESTDARPGHAEWRDLAQQWLTVDPDPDTRAELEALLAAPGDHGLADRFGARLQFGTAGLRGAMGTGPNRMNRVVVRQAAAALARMLGEGTTVVIGHDARHKSDVFAADSAAVLAAHGVAAVVLPEPLPTPVLAFAVRHLGADAGVMVTASHNPPADNGYKVYLSDGAQLIPPHDERIESAMVGAGLPPRQIAPPARGGEVRDHGGDIVAEYLDAVAPRGGAGSDLARLRVVYTPLHGVGRDVVVRALHRIGCTPEIVAVQADPDPDFPTVAFPNPEEPGALDAALALARQSAADVVLANDPDADRLAVAVPGRDGWRALTGNEVGALLAEYLLQHSTGDERLVVTTVVSSSLLEEMAAHHGVHYAETLTGFKWVVRPSIDDPRLRFVFGYEEALGYAVNDIVRDKDGITAAVAFLRMLAWLRSQGRDVHTALEQLAARHGRHLTTQVSVRFEGIDAVARMRARMAALRAQPPETIAGRKVLAVTDYLAGVDGRASTDLLRFDLDRRGRVQLRPSGTEPKLKAYVEHVANVDDQSAAAQLEALVEAARRLADPGPEDTRSERRHDRTT